ncbi:MAG: hypothetical protein Ta2A_14920 [Treponemataceae bacterium]|nr:MAG: hypothetical protein Ta2A_14920 [Treponemataceae bacterium]
MKHLFSKKSQTARRVWTQIFSVGTIAIIAAITVAGFSCQNASPTVSGIARSGGGNGDSSNLKVIGLYHAVGAAYTNPMPFEKAPDETSYSLTVDANDVTVWINPEVDSSGASITYQTIDNVTHTTSEKLDTIGMVKLNISQKSDMSLKLFIGTKVYTIRIYKKAHGDVVYVSPSGDGSGNDNDDGQRGLTPETAFYSLHKAVEKAVGLGDYKHVVVLGVLKQDKGGVSSDTSSVFQISNTNGKRLIISGGNEGQYKDVEPGLSAEGAADAEDRAKRVLSISGGSHVELVGLTISGSGKKNDAELYDSFADNGAGILASGTGTAVTLRGVTVTENTAQESGGGIYIDGASVELGEGTRVYENSVDRGASYGTSVYYGKGTLTFSGDGAALRVDTTTSAINDAVLGKIPDTVFVTETNTVTVDGTASPLIDFATYHGLAAYIVVSTEKYINGTQVLEGEGVTNSKTDNRFMRFRSFGGAQLWAINESGKLASSESYYVGATGGNDYYDGLSPDTAFNSLECALAYANAATNQGSSINRKLTVLSELTGNNHTDLRYPGVLAGGVTSTSDETAGPALFDITFDGKAQNKDGMQEDASNLRCTVDIVITASADTRFACNFTDAMLTFADITLYKSTYKRSQVYADATLGLGVVKATDVVFSDDLQVGGSFAGTVIVDAAAGKPVVFKRALSSESVRYFAGAACDVTVKFGQLNFMGKVKSLTINGGLVTDEHNTDTDSTAETVLLMGGRLVVTKPFAALVHKYPEGALSFEGGYIPYGANSYGIVLHDATSVRADKIKAIETHDPEAYFVGAVGQSFISKIYLDLGDVPQLRGYKAFDFTNLASGSDAAVLANRGKSIADVAALYPLETEHTQYVWQIGADSANTKALGLIGRPFVVGDVINYEKTFYKDPASFDEDWNPLPSELTERTSVIYKINGGEVWKAMYWGLLTDDHNPTNHDNDEKDDDGNWFGTTGNAERKDGYGTIPGGTAHHSGHWQIPKETDGGFGASVDEGSNNIKNDEWNIIKTGLHIHVIAASHTLGSKEGFWTEASMGPALGYAAIGGVVLLIGIAIGLLIAFAVFFTPATSTMVVTAMERILVTTAASMAAAGYISIGAGAGLGVLIGQLLGAGLAGKSMFEMIYKPSEDDYELSNDDEDLHPTILIQRFDNYVCYDPDPVHAL